MDWRATDSGSLETHRDEKETLPLHDLRSLEARIESPISKPRSEDKGGQHQHKSKSPGSRCGDSYHWYNSRHLEPRSDTKESRHLQDSFHKDRKSEDKGSQHVQDSKSSEPRNEHETLHPQDLTSSWPKSEIMGSLCQQDSTSLEPRSEYKESLYPQYPSSLEPQREYKGSLNLQDSSVSDPRSEGKESSYPQYTTSSEPQSEDKESLHLPYSKPLEPRSEDNVSFPQYSASSEPRSEDKESIYPQYSESYGPKSEDKERIHQQDSVSQGPQSEDKAPFYPQYSTSLESRREDESNRPQYSWSLDLRSEDKANLYSHQSLSLDCRGEDKESIRLQDSTSFGPRSEDKPSLHSQYSTYSEPQSEDKTIFYQHPSPSLERRSEDKESIRLQYSMSSGPRSEDKESVRLQEDQSRVANWKRWGPYLSERQWGTVREDYSPNGECWSYLSHDDARSRAYRWGEDGLAGICDRQARLCLSLALWNKKDDILKERLFGLTGPQGNHGEDVKELYYYLDCTPTHSYMRYLYKYPQQAYPYEDLERGNTERNVDDPEYEIEDTGVFAQGYWDVMVEYGKAAPNDILMEITVTNRGKSTETLHVIPMLWYRNTWIWGCTHEGCGMKPKLKEDESESYKSYEHSLVRGSHESLGDYMWAVDKTIHGVNLLFTENESNTKKLYGVDSHTPYVKDAFHRYIVHGEKSAVNPSKLGTKTGAEFIVTLAAGKSETLRTRLWQAESFTCCPSDIFGTIFSDIMSARREEADKFYAKVLNPRLSADEKLVSRQALASLLWTKQFYHYIVKDWLSGDMNQPPPPDSRRNGRNADWQHLYNRDVISMPDKWEYPWYASWDLAFHTVALALVDYEFAKNQLLLFLREWYMHPNGQIPAYEFALGDVNPPVHAWAVMNVYRGHAKQHTQDVKFLAKCFQKLSLNFTWWVNRKDPHGRNLFGGGFLGLDNVGVFDRSRPMPVPGQLEQADGTAWMAFFCVTMLDMALTLAEHDPVYEDMASKYFEHFILIVDAINCSGQGRGLWDEEDGFYYDYIRKVDGTSMPLKIRSLVGLTPLFAVLVLVRDEMRSLPGFYKRANWLISNRPDLAARVAFLTEENSSVSDRMLLAVPTKAQLLRLLGYLLDEEEFLSPFGIRSLSKVHENSPYVLEVGKERYEVSYVPGESNTYVFGGNSNWRGPIWLPMNFLIITSLKRYHFFYGNDLKVECPKGSGTLMTLEEVAVFLAKRLSSLFLPRPDGSRPCHGKNQQYRDDPAWRDLILFYEFFHGESGRGCGASHQTGWTALVANCLNITLGYSHSGLANNNGY